MRPPPKTYEQRWSAAADLAPRVPEALRWAEAIPGSASLEARRGHQAEERASWSDRTCRWLNIAAATGLLVLAAPLMLMIAVLIKLTSRGPIIYTQPRVGLDRRGKPIEACTPIRCRRASDNGGRIFTIYKFRTMRVDGDRRRQVWARPDDDRVTALGRVLRSYRLDELPQLFNVLMGDMNLVGPRPEQPRIFSDLRAKVDRYQDRQRVLPGITGWAQVNHRYDHNLEDVKKKIRYDLEYIQRRSPGEDLKIMVRTVPAVLLGKGGH